MCWSETMPKQNHSPIMAGLITQTCWSHLHTLRNTCLDTLRVTVRGLEGRPCPAWPIRGKNWRDVALSKVMFTAIWVWFFISEMCNVVLHWSIRKQMNRTQNKLLKWLLAKKQPGISFEISAMLPECLNLFTTFKQSGLVDQTWGQICCFTEKINHQIKLYL